MSRPHPLLLGIAADRAFSTTVAVTREVAASAIEHRMQGLLWEWIEDSVHPIGDEVTELLAPTVIAARRRSRRLQAVAAELTEKLGRSDLEVAVFKGIAAEKRWYGSSGDRPAVDLDLWLSPHQLGRAQEVVAALQPTHPLASQISDLATTRQIRSVDLVWNQIPVDLHFDPFKFGIWYDDLQSIWADTEDIGDGVRALGAAAELLTALLHLNKDRFSRLLGFVDVVRGSADTDVAEDTWRLAKDIGVSVPVGCSAKAIGDTLGVEIPIPTPRRGWRTEVWSASGKRRLQADAASSGLDSSALR